MTTSATGPAEPTGPTGPTGPIEDNVWPTQLLARVVDPEPPRRVHGYAVDDDLARYHRFSDLILLALTGELPDAPTSRAFEQALLLAAPIDIAQAPVHAGSITHMCGAAGSETVAVIGITLAEHSRTVVAAHRGLLDWLRAPDGLFPADYLAPTAELADDARAAAHILDDLDVPAPWADDMPTRTAALLTVLSHCDLDRPEQFQQALFLARLPCALAEAQATPRLSFDDYPMGLPPFAFVGPHGH